MAEYISREAAIEQFRKSLDGGYVLTDEAQTTHILQSIPAADVVPVGAYNQAAWERDTAIEQLKQIGKSFGEQMDDVRPVEWIPVTEQLPEIHTMVLVMDKAHDMAVGIGTANEKLMGGLRKTTNADRIRAMTDEELAELLGKSDAYCPPLECPIPNEVCQPKVCWLDWLKEEAQ